MLGTPAGGWKAFAAAPNSKPRGNAAALSTCASPLPLLAVTRRCRAWRNFRPWLVVNSPQFEDANMSKLLTTLIAAVFAAVSFAAAAADTATAPAKPADTPKAEAKAPEAKAEAKTTKKSKKKSKKAHKTEAKAETTTP